MAEAEIVIRAAHLAAQKHRGQVRKGVAGYPYINHPIEVAYELVRVAGVSDAPVLAAALLHDVVEDTDVTPGDIEAEFGRGVREIVDELTDDMTLDKPSRKKKQFEMASELSHDARLIRIADKICNLRDILDDPPPGWTPERKAGYFEWCKAVVDRIRGTNAALEAEFDRVHGASHASE
ncbi:HD domain-containing protein [bacterium]|nr:HD domain-containing protein [bacterium]